MENNMKDEQGKQMNPTKQDALMSLANLERATEYSNGLLKKSSHSEDIETIMNYIVPTSEPESVEMSALKLFKREAEDLGLKVHAVALKGSQNYNLNDDESDVDANLVFIPTIPQIRKNEKFKITTKYGDCICHNIYSFAEIVAKGNPQWIEVCNTKYVIGDLSKFKNYKLNPSALKGMVMEKVNAFDKIYPSRAHMIEKFGYDPKQLHHIIRLYDSLSNDDASYKYYGEEREKMLDIKRGRFPNTKEEAENLRDEYVEKLSVIYEDKKMKYKKQIVNYEEIDKIVMDFYKGL